VTERTGTPAPDHHLMPLHRLYETLGTGEDGLSSAEAAGRLARLGPNELKVKGETPEIVKFLRQFRNFFAVLLIVGGLLALLAERLDSGQGNLYIAIALFAVVLLNAAFTYLQEYKSERIMESFERMLPSMVEAVRDGVRVRIPARDLVPGDVMLLFEGDRVPADGRLIEEKRLTVDISSLTGESEPLQLDSSANHAVLLESRNMVFSGALVQSGDAKAVVCETGMATQIGRIVTLTKGAQTMETPIHREIAHFVRVIGFIAVALGVVFFLASVALGKGSIGSLIFAIGIIVANVPEGLLPTVTLALTMASGRMAEKKALIRNLESVETLGSTTLICTDKTGTLTQNRLGVSSVVFGADAFSPDDRRVLDSPAAERAFEAMALCNNAALTEAGYSGDPTEGALLVYVARHGSVADYHRHVRLDEEPFSSASRRMITVCCLPRSEARRAYLKGAPEVVLAMCDRAADRGGTVEMSPERQAREMERFEDLAEGGERGLAIAWRDLGEDEHGIPTEGYVYAGLVGMIDPPRPEVPEAIAKCRTAGIRVAMVTGDFGLTAASIARQIGLFTGPGLVIHGDELAEKSEAELSRLLDEPEIVFARLSPEQKLDIVRAFQKRGEVVTVTGDGVNDAPALKNADMGVAMGVIGTDVAKEASNMVLMDDNFATIVAAIEEGRTIFDNIKKFIAYILTSNVPEILPFIAYALLDMPLALTVVLILAIDLGTDLLPALGLGAEKAETDVMRKPPRPRHERLLSWNLLLMSYGVVGMIQAAAGFFSFFVILYAGGWEWGRELASQDELYRTALTGFFASIVICQVADVLICRTRRQSILSIGIFSNRLILLGIATELFLVALIAYVPACNVFFGTAPLEPWHLALSLPFAILIVAGDELRRVFVRRENAFVLRWLTW
jgi:sodium/potassium-transporting ATPase subunit alpha